MSLLRLLPSGTTHILSNDGLEFLPPFVGARLKYLAAVFDWWSEECVERSEEDENEEIEENGYEECVERSDEDRNEEIEENQTRFTYHEVRGKLSNGYYNAREGAYIAPMNFWIASDDNCNRSLYIGGSSCWICPNSHYLFFDRIDPVLFTEQPDPNVWWCIQYEERIKIIKIIVCPSEEITEHFPDGV
jgi:hypothetical protein